MKEKDRSRTRDILGEIPIELEKGDFCLRIFDDFPSPIWCSGLDTKCNYFNKAWLQLTGLLLEHALGDGWLECVHPEDRSRCKETHYSASKHLKPFEVEYRIRRYDGAYRWFVSKGRPFFNKENKCRGFIGTCCDITDAKRVDDIVANQNKFLNLILESLTYPFCIIDASDYTVKMANRAAYAHKLPEEAKCYSLLYNRKEPCYKAGQHCMLEKVKKTKGAVTIEHIHRDSEGNPHHIEIHGFPIFDDDENVIQIIKYSFDITERKQQEKQLAYLASHDQLTGVFNRYFLEKELSKAVSRAKRGRTSALMVADLDDFKVINDSLGHVVGDEVLIALAGLLQKNLRHEDTVARLGGDEFVILMQDIDFTEALEVAQRILMTVSEFPFSLDELDFKVTLSVGACLVDGKYKPLEVLSKADAAMYRAKELGKNRLYVWNEESKSKNRNNS